jgi:hypothetical protein
MLSAARTWLFVAMLGAASACASAVLDVTSPVVFRVRTATLVIRDETRGDISPAQLEHLEATVAAELRNSGIAVVPKGSADATDVVGAVERYDRGIRAMRFVTHYGFGTGSLASRWEAMGPRSDAPATCSIEGSISLGTFGGSFDDVEKDVGRALARFLKGKIE